MLARRYPFIINVVEYVEKELGRRASVAVFLKDPWIAELARERLLEALRRGVAPDHSGETLHEELGSFVLALAAAKAAGPRVLNRYVDAEAERAYKLIQRESMDSLVELARVLGLDVRVDSIKFPWMIDKSSGKKLYRVLPLSVGLASYLKYASAIDDRELDVVNSFLLGGRVYLDRGLLERLLRGVVRDRIRGLAEGISLDELVDDPKFREAVEEASRVVERTLKGVEWEPSKFPPCVSKLIEKAKATRSLKSLDDKEAYLLVSFLANLTPSTGELEELLPNLGGSELRALYNLIRYAIEKKARIYTCRYIRLSGLCPKRCGGPTPLHAYRNNFAGRVLPQHATP